MRPGQNGTYGESHTVYWLPLKLRSWWERLSPVEGLQVALCVIGSVIGGSALVILVRRRKRDLVPEPALTAGERTKGS